MENYIPVYPDVSNSDIQNLISHKEEFLELKTNVKEEIPEEGGYFKHQLFVQRYMANYDRLLIIHETGTGKTRSFIAFAEYARKNLSTIRHVYILAPGPRIIEEFKRQIKSVPGYEHLQGLSTRGVNAEIRKWYTITTFRKFADKISKNEDEYNVTKYSGCAFFIDEAHLLRNVPIPRSKREIEEAKSKGEILKEKLDVNLTLSNLFDKIKRSKVVIGTATPIVNNVSEIARLMNIILPVGMKMPKNADYNNASLEQVEPYFRGRIVYIRSMDSGTKIEYEGDFIKDVNGNRYIHKVMLGDRIKEIPSQFIVKTLKMVPGGIQESVYNKITNQDVEVKIDPDMENPYLDQKVNTDAYKTASRQAATFVFPDGSIAGSVTKVERGGENKMAESGLGKYVYSEQPYKYKTTDELKEWMRDNEKLKQLSSKFAFIIRNELNQNRNGLSGVTYIFIDFVEGAGAILLSECFKANGYEMFDNSRSVFDENGEVAIEPKLRYALLHGSEKNVGSIDAMFELLNSKENIYGQYINTIIVSPTARQGTNVFNVIRAYLVTAGWHPAGIRQAMTRFDRVVAHKNMLDDIKRRLADEGKDPSKAVIKIKVYNLASINNQGRSVDVDLFISAEDKDIQNSRMLRFMKQCAVDGYINRDRNLRDSDIDGSSRCDYTICKYPLFDYREGPIDYSTFNIIYYQNRVKYLISEVSKILTLNGYVTYDELSELNETKSVNFNNMIMIAINKMINDKHKVLNRFGYISFVKSDGYRIYLERGADMHGNVMLYNYSNQLTGNFINKADEVINDLISDNQEEIKDRILQMDPKTEALSINLLIEKLSNAYKIGLFEHSVSKILRQEHSEIDIFIYNKFKFFLFWLKKPIVQLKQSLEGKEFSLEGVWDGPLVYFHTMGSVKSEDTGYNENIKYFQEANKIRIYDQKTNSWEDAQENEKNVYSQFAKMEIGRRMDKYNKLPIYGSILFDGKFRIHGRVGGEKLTQKRKGRTKFKGKVCSTWTKTELVNLVKSLSGVHNSASMNKEYLCNYIKKYFHDNDMLFIP